MTSRWTPAVQGAYLSQPALPLPRQVVTIDAWSPLAVEQIGTKPKQWFEAPSGARWLFKEVTRNPKRGGGSYLRGDDWAEVVSSDTARMLGLPTAAVELALRFGTRGVVSRSVARSAALIHGNEVLAGRSVEYAASDDRANPRYTVDAVMEVMREVGGPPDSYLTAEAAFAGYLVLDAVVGNTDRHHQNWAVLRVRGELHLSPTFDHASSLGFLLDDDGRRTRLRGRDGDRTVASYAARARTPFADATTPSDAALRALSVLPARSRIQWRDRLEALETDDLEQVVASVPEPSMSDASREFAVALMVHNRNALLQGMGGLA